MPEFYKNTPAAAKEGASHLPTQAMDWETFGKLAPEVKELPKGYDRPGFREGLSLQGGLESAAQAFLRDATEVEPQAVESVIGTVYKTRREIQREHAANELRRATEIEEFYKKANGEFARGFDDPLSVAPLSDVEEDYLAVMVAVRCQGEGATSKTGNKLGPERVSAIGELAKLETKLVGKRDAAPMTTSAADLLRTWGLADMARAFEPGLDRERVQKVQDMVVRVYGLKSFEEYLKAEKASPRSAFTTFVQNAMKNPGSPS